MLAPLAATWGPGEITPENGKYTSASVSHVPHSVNHLADQRVLTRWARREMGLSDVEWRAAEEWPCSCRRTCPPVTVRGHASLHPVSLHAQPIPIISSSTCSPQGPRVWRGAPHASAGVLSSLPFRIERDIRRNPLALCSASGEPRRSLPSAVQATCSSLSGIPSQPVIRPSRTCPANGRPCRCEYIALLASSRLLEPWEKPPPRDMSCRRLVASNPLRQRPSRLSSTLRRIKISSPVRRYTPLPRVPPSNSKKERRDATWPSPNEIVQNTEGCSAPQSFHT